MFSRLGSPLLFFKGLIMGSFASTRAFMDMLSYTSPLIMTGLSFAVAARANLFNIGAEGQMYLGALAAVVLGHYVRLPPVIHHLVVLASSFLLGGAWGLIAGVLKIKREVNEVVSTIMLNWIAYWMVNYIAVFKIYQPGAAWRTKKIQESCILPFLARGTTLSIAMVLGIISAVITYYILWRTRLGYSIRAVGLNPTAAEYGGINVEKTMAIAMLISGGCAGLAGAFEVMGRFYFLDTSLRVIWGRGFDGIAVSLIGKNHPLGILPASLLIATLEAGAHTIQVYTSRGGMGVPYELTMVITGVIIVMVSTPMFLKYLGVALKKIIRRR